MPLIIIGVNAMISCTSFQEEEISVSFGVNTTELSFLADGDSRSVTVSSGTKWDVSGMPSWISLGAINRSGHSPYEWIVNFSAAGNDEYNRDGTIIIKSGLDVAEIAVTQEGKKGRYIAVESISVSPKELTLTEGENASLIFSISPVNASIKDVTWKSSSPSVATVSENGIIEALAVGATTITVTTEDGGKTASCDVTVQSKVISAESVSLDKTELVMKLGETHALIATVNPSSATNKEVIWTSTDSKVAAVSSSGVVTAKGYGTATIRVATVDGGFTADCHVGVYTPIQDLSISMPTSLTITEGEIGLLSVNINVDIEDVHIDPLLELYSKWVVEDESIVSIQWEDSNSLRAQLRALSVGTTRVTNILKDRFGSMTLSCDVTVVKTKVPVTGVSLNAPSISMTIGDTQTLSATVIPSNATDKSVTWSSSNTSVATVSSSGVVTAKAAGEATITVKTNDGGYTASCIARVYSEVVSLSLPINHLQLVEGMSYTMSANSTTTTIAWSSDNPSVASISASGVIITNSVGQATITARAGDKEALCVVYVYYRDYRGYQAVDLDLPSGVKWASFNLGASKPEEYGDFYAWGETESKSSFYENYIYTDPSSDHYCKYHPNYSQPYNSHPTLEPTDDAAHVNWGGSWRMPTFREVEELINSCYWEWSSINGINGYVVTSKTNGNSIFMPVGGEFAGESVRNSNSGYYWTSTANDNSWGSNQLIINSGSYSRQFGNTWSMYGAAVRAVSY